MPRFVRKGGKPQTYLVVVKVKGHEHYNIAGVDATTPEEACAIIDAMASDVFRMEAKIAIPPEKVIHFPRKAR